MKFLQEKRRRLYLEAIPPCIPSLKQGALRYFLLAGIRKTVKDILSDMRESGEVAPVPLAEKNYSGRFVVRVPPEVHRELAVHAAEQGVSLNRLISSKLAA